jgi:hypothetical protein
MNIDQELIRRIFEYYGIDAAAMSGKSREAVRLKQLFSAALSSETTLSAAEIGRILGYKEHSSVCYGKKMQEFYELRYNLTDLSAIRVQIRLELELIKDEFNTQLVLFKEKQHENRNPHRPRRPRPRRLYGHKAHCNISRR